MPDRNRSERPFNERDEKLLQRAVLAFLLEEFPAKHTEETLVWMGLGQDTDALGRAIQSLDVVGLLWCEGQVVMPTAAARHFDWLELP